MTRLGRMVLICLTTLSCVRNKAIIEYDAQTNRIVHSPTFIGTGDSLILLVRDSVWANDYSFAKDTAGVPVASAAPIAGAVDLTKLAEGIPASLLAPKNAAPSQSLPSGRAAHGGNLTFDQQLALIAPKSRDSLQKYQDILKQLEDTLTREIVVAESAAAPAHLPDVSNAVRKDSLCDTALMRFSRFLLANPDQSTVLAFLVDDDAVTLASELARDPVALKPDTILRTLRTRTIMDTAGLNDFLRPLGQFRRKLSLLGAYLPLGGNFKPAPDSLGKYINSVREKCIDPSKQADLETVQARKDVLEHLRADLEFAQRGPALHDTSNIRTPLPALPRLEVVGVDVMPLILTSTRAQDVAVSVAILNRQAARLAAVANVVPTMTTNLRRYGVVYDSVRHDSVVSYRVVYDTVSIGTFSTPVRLRITPQRRDRFTTLVPMGLTSLTAAAGRSGDTNTPTAGSAGDKTPAVALIRISVDTSALTKRDGKEKKPKSSAKTGAVRPADAKPENNDKPADGSDTSDAGKKDQGTASDNSASSTPSTPPTQPPPPIATIDVLQRYRFRLGVGVTRSKLRTLSYSLHADTVVDSVTKTRVPGQRVQVVGEAPQQYVAMVTLGYTLLPLRGRVTDAQAYALRDRMPGEHWRHYAAASIGHYLYQAGLDAQVGLSLSDPTKRVVIGVATEVLPGVTLGYGTDFAYVEESTFANNTFVADTAGPATRKRWRQKGGAITVSLDASVVVAALGKLVGLK